MRILRRGTAAPPHQRDAVAAMEGGDVAEKGGAADGVGDTPAAKRPPEDSECVGWQVRVFWPRMKKWYKGTISDYDPCRGTFDAELGQNCGAWRAPPLCPPSLPPVRRARHSLRRARRHPHAGDDHAPSLPIPWLSQEGGSTGTTAPWRWRAAGQRRLSGRSRSRLCEAASSLLHPNQ